MGGKLMLAGEAFMQIRPHLGASCNTSYTRIISFEHGTGDSRPTEPERFTPGAGRVRGEAGDW